MDGQNLQNEQNTTEESVQTTNNYQDYTANVEPVAVETAAEPPKKTNSLAVVSLVLGIISIVLGCCGSWIAIVLGIGGIVCAVMANKEEKTGMAKAGMICSIIGIILAIVVLIFAIAFSVVLFDEMNAMGYY